MTHLPLAAALALLFVVACAAEPTPKAPVELTQGASPTVPPTQRGPAPPATPAPASPTATSVTATPALALDAEGLRLFNRDTGAARPITFAAPRAQVLAMLDFRGRPGTGRQADCGAGPLDFAAWPDGLKLYFQRDKFVGWAVDGRGIGALATAAGIGPGSSRAALSDAYAATFSKTTLGTEFAAGGVFGLLDGPGMTATISDMWAGVSCNFR